MTEPDPGGIWIDMEQAGGLRPGRPVDPLTDPIPEDQTRLGDSALTLHELARAEHRNRLKARIGTVYRSRETMARRIGRWLRGIS